MRPVQYNDTLYNSRALKEIAREYIDCLPSSVTCLVSRGASGCAIATAMLMLAPRILKHYHIRKEYSAHASHGGFFPQPHDVLAFVDDFINLGGTVQYVQGQLSQPLDYVIVSYITQDVGLKVKEYLESCGTVIIEGRQP